MALPTSTSAVEHLLAARRRGGIEAAGGSGRGGKAQLVFLQTGDGTFVYWGASDSVVAVEKASGTRTVIAASQSHPSRLANDERRIYWVNTGSDSVLPNAAPPGVYSLRKGGGAVDRVAGLTARPNAALALTSSDVYWGDGARIRRAAKVTP